MQMKRLLEQKDSEIKALKDLIKTVLPVEDQT